MNVVIPRMGHMAGLGEHGRDTAVSGVLWSLQPAGLNLVTNRRKPLNLESV